MGEVKASELRFKDVNQTNRWCSKCGLGGHAGKTCGQYLKFLKGFLNANS